jgi:hypothetical protein
MKKSLPLNLIIICLVMVVIIMTYSLLVDLFNYKMSKITYYRHVSPIQLAKKNHEGGLACIGTTKGTYSPL